MHRRRIQGIASLGITWALALAVALPSTALAQSWRPKSTPATPPTAAQIDEAKDRYQKGIKLYEEDGLMDAALAELERSYELAPNYKVLYNIGQVARSVPDYVTALLAYERYLADGGADVVQPRRGEVEKEIASLKDRVAYLEISCNLEGAVVTIDDNEVGKTPLREPIMVNPGRRKVVVSKGALTATSTVTVVGKDRQRVPLELKEGAGAAPTSTSAPTAPPSGTTGPVAPPDQPSYVWVGWVFTGALVVGTGVTGGLAIAAADDLKKTTYARTPAEQQSGTLPSDLLAKQDSVRTLAILSDVFLGASAVAFTTTLIFQVRGKSTAPAPAASGAVKLRAFPGGAAIQGSF